MKDPLRPPIHTIFVEILSWTMARTSDLPKSHRFTFGQRIDNQTLDALELVVRAIFLHGISRMTALEELNLKIETLRVLWRIVHQQQWISAQQLFFVTGQLDEAGRMTGGWIRQMKPTAKLHSHSA